MLFLVDENLGKRFAGLLNKAGHDAIFVGDVMRGADDEKILERGTNERRVVVTDDKDFGELVFRLKMATNGIILLRTLAQDAEERFRLVFEILNKAEGRFIVVSEGRTRIRKL